MSKRQSPKLRTVTKSIAAYPLNQFNSELPYILGQEIVYLLASKGRPDLQGDEWEQIFAKCIGADWKPSNVGLDDVVMGNTAWGAKTVKSNIKDFKKLKQIRLISGRNPTVYSYGGTVDTNADPNVIGDQVLEIWNERVSSIREKFKHLRTVVLVKSNDLSQVAVFEFDTVRYDSNLYEFIWNKNGNLEGYNKGAEHKSQNKRFTWQPHGSQFTITEEVPEQTLILKIKQPEKLDKAKILDAIGFDKTWVTIERK